MVASLEGLPSQWAVLNVAFDKIMISAEHNDDEAQRLITWGAGCAIQVGSPLRALENSVKDSKE